MGGSFERELLFSCHSCRRRIFAFLHLSKPLHSVYFTNHSHTFSETAEPRAARVNSSTHNPPRWKWSACAHPCGHGGLCF